MTFIISNKTGIDVNLYIDNEKHIIKSNDLNVSIKTNDNKHNVFVSRIKPCSLPNYKEMLWTEILGVLAVLFIKPLFYTFDISSHYDVFCNSNEKIFLNIIRVVNEGNPEGIYDAICVDSCDLQFLNVTYCVQNKAEILKMYQKCRGIGRRWLYSIIIVLFTLIGIAITHPLLLIIYSATKALFVKILLFLIPILLIGCIGVVGILPLHLVFKYQDRNFYRAMEEQEIFSFLSKR